MIKIQRQTSAHYLSRLLAMIISLFFMLPAYADETNPVFSTQTQIGSDGLAIQQPMISQTEILQTLTRAHLLLSQQSKQAETVLEKNSSPNLVVAAVMPGGLLYLAYQKSKINQAQKTLNTVKNELASLDTDAISLYEPVQKPIIIARYP